MRTRSIIAALLLTALTSAAFAQGRPPLAPLLLESSAFEDGGIVPDKYTFRGSNVQPGFKISHAPAGTQSFAIIFHDLDVALQGGTDDVLHWTVWNIPGTTTEIPEGKLPEGAVTGKNVTGQNTYMGPGAPPGPTQA